MKRSQILVWLTVLAMLLTAVPAYAAEPASVMRAYDIRLNQETGMLAVRQDRSRGYILMDADGSVLNADEYSSLYPNGAFFTVETGEGVQDKGLMDSTGRIVIPAEYMDTYIISDRWQLAYKCVPADADNYDFTDYNADEKSFYLIDTVDFFYRGEKVGSLTRKEYDSYSANACGDYLSVRSREGAYSFYDKTFTKSPVEPEYSAEFNEDYRTGTVTHQGSGQQAFTAGCTLTPDSVAQSIRVVDGTGYDLQGNELFRLPHSYDYVRDFSGGYAQVYLSGKYGLVDAQGNEVIPCEYDELGHYEDEPLKYGCISAVKDGKLGFLDAQGNVTCDFRYADSAADNRVTFASIQDLTGEYIVLSGLTGELPEHYAEVSFPGYDGCAAFIAKKTTGEIGVIGLNGQELIPFRGDLRSVYAVSLTDDCTLAAVETDDGYEIWHLDPIGGAAQAAPAGDGTWTCENGHTGNTGNFCGECGAKKPEGDGTWTCENGHAGNTGNFCGECGAKKP